jgi:hypothetical protein
LRVKVCCIASVEEALIAIDAGAAALGLVSAMPSGPGVIAEATIAAIAAAVDVRFGGHREDGRRVRHRAQDRLAADDDELVLPRDVATRANDVLQLFACHRGTLLTASPSTTPFFSAVTCFSTR